MKSFKYIIIIYLIVFVTSLGYCQIKTDQVEVVKDFEAQLEDAQKVTLKPQIIVTKTESKKYRYDVTIVPLDIKYADPVIKPLSANPDQPFDFDQLWLKGGYGSLKNPFLQFRWAKAGDDKYEINAYADYFALDNTGERLFQNSSDLLAGLDLKYRNGENLLFKAGAKTNYDKRNFYFTPVDLTLSTAEKLKRNTFEISGYAGIQNIEAINDRLDYNLTAQLTALNTTNFSANEQILDIDGNARYKLSSSLFFNVPLELQSIRYDVIDVADVQTNFIADINPTLQFLKKRINFTIGAELLADTDGARLWPMALLSIGLVGNNIHAFAGIDQKKVVNDLKNILEFSPWANSRFSQLNLNVGREYFGGVRGDLGPLRYEGRAGYRQNKNQTLFTNYRVVSLESNDKLSIDYTDMTTIFLNGNIDFNVSENIAVGGNLIKNFYDPAFAPQAYGLLGLEGNAYAKISLLGNKVNLRSDLYLADRVWSIFPNANNVPNFVRGTNLFDLNIGLEAFVLKNVGLYIDGYNVLNNKNVRWYGYPQAGIHFNGGVILKF